MQIKIIKPRDFLKGVTRISPKRYLHCACPRCENRQAVEIGDFLIGKPVCGCDLNRPMHVHPDDPWPPPTFDPDGEPMTPPYTPKRCYGELFIASWDGQSAMENTHAFLAWLKDNGHIHEAFGEIAEEILQDGAEVLAPPETPQQMGWVSDRGTP